MTTCSIYILSYGDPANASACAELIVASDDCFAISIVHNPTREFPSFGPCSRGIHTVIETGRNLGYAGGMNVALRHGLASASRYVLLLTHDVRIDSESVQCLIRFLEENPSVGIAGPRLIERDGSPYSCGGTYRHGIAEHLTSPTSSSPDWIDGAAMLIRHECLDEIGFFDERLFMYWEDVDLSLRAGRLGWSVRCATSSVATQEHGSVATRGKAYAYLMRRNQLVVRMTHDPSSKVALLAIRRLMATLRHPLAFNMTVARAEIDAVCGKLGPPPKQFRRDTDIQLSVEPTRLL